MGHYYNRRDLCAVYVSLWAQKEEVKAFQCVGERAHSGLQFITGEEGSRGAPTCGPCTKKRGLLKK